ncbi:phosphate transport system ATP-binding protein, partial [Candidatus Hakubella thermalkaliphila]
PCSAVEPAPPQKLEDLMRARKERSTIIIVTHDMQRAARVSGYTAFLMMTEEGTGELVEYGPTDHLFTRPKDKRTEDYITGRFG